MQLAGKAIEQLVLTGGDIERTVKEGDGEFLNYVFAGGDGITTVVLALRHAGHLGHRAFVELAHDGILKEVAALYLAADLIGLAVAGVYTGHVGQTVGVRDALREG